MTQTLAVINAKVILSVGNRDLFSLVDVSRGHDRHALVTPSCQATVGITVMIGKTSGTQKERWGFAATRHHNAEVFAGQAEIQLFFMGHRHESSTQVFDLLALFNEPASTDCSLMLRYDVSIGRGDLKRTVWKIHLNVLAEVSAEPLLLSGATEVCHVFL